MEEAQIKAAKARYEQIGTDVNVFKVRVMTNIAEQNSVEDKLTFASSRTRTCRKVVYMSSAVAASVMIVLASGYVSSALAQTLKQVPLLESVFRLAKGWGLQTADERGLSIQVGQRVERKGIAVTLSELVYDESQLSIGVVQHAPGGIKEIYDLEVYVDGKQIEYPFSSNQMDVEKSKDKATAIYTRASVGLPDQFELKLKMFLDGYGIPWEFTVPVRKSAAGSKVVTSEVSQSLGELTTTVRKVVLTPTETSIEVELAAPREQTDDPMYKSLLSSVESGKFYVQNENGVKLEYGGARPSEERRLQAGKVVMSYVLIYSAFRTMPRTLLVRPYIPEEAGREIVKVPITKAPSMEQPLTLDQGPLGRIEIYQMEYLSDKTVIHYRTEGLDPYGVDWFWLEDARGGSVEKIGERRVLDPDTYSFVKEFAPLERSEPVVIVKAKPSAIPRFIPELDMKIHIP